MNFLIPEDDVLRHKTLEIIYNRIMSFAGRTVKDENVALPITDIAKQIGISVEKLNFIAMSLKDDEVRYEGFGIDKGLCLLPNEGTANAYTNNKYLKQGRTHIITRLKDYFGITTAIFAIITALITATTAILSIGNNQKRIEELEKVVQQLKAQSGQSNLQKISDSAKSKVLR